MITIRTDAVGYFRLPASQIAADGHDTVTAAGEALVRVAGHVDRRGHSDVCRVDQSEDEGQARHIC